MRQSAAYLATVAMLAIAYRSTITPAAMLELPRRFRAPALAPIDALVDWLEAAYGGPIEKSDA